MSLPPELWDGAVRRLGAELSHHALEAWILPLVAEPGEGGLRLRCPSAFHRDRIAARFRAAIERCVEAEAGRRIGIELDVQAPGAAVAARGARAKAPGAAGGDARAAVASAPAGGERGGVRGCATARLPRQDASTGAPWQPAMLQSFETFIVGPCNALAREASLAVARDAQRPANPLFLVSESGLGKTHLARAIAAEASRRGRERCVYEPAETFTNRFLAAIRERGMEAFKRRYRGCELLLLEDVQFLRTKTATQLELFHTLSHLVDAGVRVVLTADRLPRDIDGLETRLRSRMGAGLVAEIEAPDAAVRREILRAKAAHGGIRLPEPCLDLLVDSVRGSVRDLEGVLIQLVASASLLGRPIDAELTRRALHKLAPVDLRRPELEVGAVVRAVAAFFGTTPEALAARSRRRDVLLPRQLAMYLCREYTAAPLAEIARAFGRDHPSVANAVRQVERGILERAPLRYQVEELAARLERLGRRQGPGKDGGGTA